MIKVIIIDDEPLAISVVEEYLKKHPDMMIVSICNNGFEGVKAIQQHHPDLIFLDIQMPKINGFEMLELIETPPAVIFATAFDEYAIKAFEANAIDYLLKPFSEDRFNKALNKWKEKRNNSDSNQTKKFLEGEAKTSDELNRIVVKSGSNVRIIPIHEVICIEAYDDYVKIHIEGDVFLKKKTMQFFENSLDPKNFVRIHRSFIVQLQQITKVEPQGKETYTAILRNGTQIPLSKTGYSRLREVWNI